MDRRAIDDRRRIGTVKAAINMYGERILESNSSLKTPQIDLPENSSSRAKELHKAKRDMFRYKESRRMAESVKAEAETELSTAKRTVKGLASQIEESNSKAKAKMRDMERLRRSSKRDESGSDSRSLDGSRYAEMMREIESVKQELSKLKLDMASVIEEKKRAEKEIEVSNSKLETNLKSVEAIRNEIEEVNEEQVLVELARIEASKEFGEIEVLREKEAKEFSYAMEENKKKLKDVSDEIDSSKDVESKLTVTLSDVDALQNELKVVKEIEKKVLRNDSLKHSSGGSFRIDEQSEGLPSLDSIMEELEAAKKELATVKQEAFQFMASMDIIRSELKHVTEETVRLKKTEQKSELTFQNLNSKLLRVKTKLEAATAAEEKAKAIVSNLSHTLEQLKTETEAAKKEKELVSTETANIKAEMQKTVSEIDLTEEKLQAAMQELEAVKASESLALENLQNLIANSMRARASSSQQSSSITISKFEYEYLTGRAVKAEEIADKKVAAAQAWVEALKANEKEILMKIEIAHREIREARVEEEQQVYRTERSLSAKKRVEGEMRNWGQKRGKNALAENSEQPLQRKSMKSYGNATPRKSMRGNGNWTPSKHGKARNSASPAGRITPGSTSFIIRKKKKVMPNLAKLFSGKRIGKDN